MYSQLTKTKTKRQNFYKKPEHLIWKNQNKSALNNTLPETWMHCYQPKQKIRRKLHRKVFEKIKESKCGIWLETQVMTLYDIGIWYKWISQNFWKYIQIASGLKRYLCTFLHHIQETSLKEGWSTVHHV